MNGGESKGATKDSNFSKPDYVKSVTFAYLNAQFDAVQNMCTEFNKRNTLSEMKYFPYGGALYRRYLDKSIPTPWCYETNDIDGRLVVIPKGLDVSDDGLRRLAKEKIINVPTGIYDRRNKEVFKDIFETFNLNSYKEMIREVYSTTFKREENGKVEWLTNASTLKFTLSLSEKSLGEEPVYTESVLERYPNFDALVAEGFFDVNPVSMENFTSKEFAIKFTMNGKTRALDLHLTFLHPPIRNSPMIKVIDGMYRTKQVSSNMFFPSKQHFLIDQMVTMFSRLYDYMALAVFDNERDIKKWQLYMLLNKTNQKVAKRTVKAQGVTKAFKTVCRVSFFSKLHKEFQNIPLMQLYNDHQDLGVQAPEYLKSSQLKRNIGLFNSLIMFELANPDINYNTYQYPTKKKSIPRKNTNNGYLNLTMREKNTRVKNLVCDDMTLGQTMTLINHILDTVKDRGEAALSLTYPTKLTQLRERLVSAFDLKNSFNLSLRF